MCCVCVFKHGTRGLGTKQIHAVALGDHAKQNVLIHIRVKMASQENEVHKDLRVPQEVEVELALLDQKVQRYVEVYLVLCTPYKIFPVFLFCCHVIAS